MWTKTELTLEQTQQGISYEVLAETGSIHMLSETPKLLSGIEDSHHGPSDAMHNPPHPLKTMDRPHKVYDNRKAEHELDDQSEDS
ncbi:hypothetical protein Tco_1355194 [Tanacetum coccineum]